MPPPAQPVPAVPIPWLPPVAKPVVSVAAQKLFSKGFAIMKKTGSGDDSTDKAISVERALYVSDCGRLLFEDESTKDEGYIALIATPITHDMIVLDCDMPAMAPRDALGYSITAAGRHYYVPPGSKAAGDRIWQDPSYRKLSKERGYYAERLFDKNGKPRQLPEILEQPGELLRAWGCYREAVKNGQHSYCACPACEMVRHRDAFALLQKKAIEKGLTRPRKRPIKETSPENPSPANP